MLVIAINLIFSKNTRIYSTKNEKSVNINTEQSVKKLNRCKIEKTRTEQLLEDCR